MIECKSFFVSIYIAGDLEIARQICRKWCMENGDCVTVEPIEYIYTGGSENGVRINWINYPRFPRTDQEMLERANKLADFLMVDLCQHSYSIMTPDKTYWNTRKAVAE
jgi:hypothetical protein